MFSSIAVYTGAAAALAGAIALFRRRTRRAGAALMAGGVGVALVTLAWPVSEEQTSSMATHLDQAMPRWQFNEIHSIHVNAEPQRVYEAIHAVRADEIALFNLLTTIRRGGRKLPESIMNAGRTKPLLDIATQTSFRYLADDPREIVVVTRVAAGTDATMNFLLTPDAHGTNVTTETRIFSTDPYAAKEFAIYWRIIHPGSDIIRRMWLRAIKRRADLARPAP